jgi:UDP-N-acetylmuramate dehydrogenase
MLIEENVPLKKLTTFQNEGVLDKVYFIETVEELKTFLSTKTPYFILGKGSNTMVNPSHSKGVCIRLSANIIPVKVSKNFLTLGAGTPVNIVMKNCIAFGLSGLEFSAGVPATIGGMIAMNFGCFGHAISEVVQSIYIVDDKNRDRWVSSDELAFDYRWSNIQNKTWVIIGATFNLKRCDSTILKKEIDRLVRLRIEKQPLKEKTFGSVFKNPPNNVAGALIEKVGLKGYELNDIRVSEKHANFFINKGNATYKDLISLIRFVQQRVQEKTGIFLELEVKLIT